jgi:hypothetical protein
LDDDHAASRRDASTDATDATDGDEDEDEDEALPWPWPSSSLPPGLK